jgi:hypothetical protein
MGEGIEDLNAGESRRVSPIIKYHPALGLVPAQRDGMHCLGIQAHGLTRKVVYEVGVWNGWLVTYLQLLNPEGAAAYKGDGKKVIVFGGIEIMPTLEQLF